MTQRTRRALTIGIFLGVGALFGAAIPEHATTALGIGFILVASVGLRAAPPQVWAGVAIASPWTERLLTGIHVAPRLFDFLDFPLVALALLTSLIAWSQTRPSLAVHHARTLRWLVIVAAMIACSWVVNNVTEPQRLLAAYLIELEPFMLVAALLLAPPTPRQRRTLVRLLLAIAGAQIIFGVGQKLTVGRHNPDHVVGTLLNSSSGQAPEAAAVLLAAFLVAVLYQRTTWSLGASAAALVMLVITDSKQVLYIVPLGLIAFTIFPKVGRLGRPAFAVASLILMLSAIAPVAVFYPGTKAVGDYLKLGSRGPVGKPPVIHAMAHNFRSEPTSILFGFGPGETVSRFAFLTTPLLLKGGSPVTLLGIPPGKYTAAYQRLATENIPPSVGISSYDQAQSSLLGILGDYGVLGAIAFVALILTILRSLWAVGRSSPIAASAFAGWIMILPLSYIFDWLEEPAYTTYLAAITGLALTWVTRRARRSSSPAPSQASRNMTVTR